MEGERLLLLYRMLVWVLVAAAAASVVFGVITYPAIAGVLLASLLGPMFAFSTILARGMIRKTRQQLVRYLTFERFLLSDDSIAMSQISCKTGFAFHPIANGFLLVGGRQVPVAIELDPGYEGESFTRPPQILVHTPWKRPDDIFVNGQYFYADVSGMHPLEKFSFRRDIWESSYEGLFTNSFFKRLDLRLLIPESKELASFEAERLKRMFECFREAVGLSTRPPGAFAPKYREMPAFGTSTVYLNMVFGFIRMEYCTRCSYTPKIRAETGAKSCPKCSAPIAKVFSRIGIGYQTPRKKAREIRKFTGEA
jgi:hypothetical protein